MNDAQNKNTTISKKQSNTNNDLLSSNETTANINTGIYTESPASMAKNRWKVPLKIGSIIAVISLAIIGLTSLFENLPVCIVIWSISGAALAYSISLMACSAIANKTRSKKAPYLWAIIPAIPLAIVIKLLLDSLIRWHLHI